MSLLSTNQTIQHPQIGDLYWMTVSVNFLIELNMGTVHTVAVHFRYDWYMRRLANEFLCRNPIESVSSADSDRANGSSIIIDGCSETW